MKEYSRSALALSICLFCLLLPLTIAGANISWGLMLASLLGYRISGGSIPLRARRSVLELPLWIYFIVVVLVSMLGVDPAHSARYLHQDFHKVWLYTLLSLALATCSPPKLLPALAIGFSAAALIGVGQSVWARAVDGAWMRAHAFVHPVTFGQQMAIGLLGAACFLVRPPAAVMPGHWAQRAGWTLLLLCGGALFLSNTRGAVLAFLGGAAAVFCFAPAMRRILLTAIPLAILAFAATGTIRSEPTLPPELLHWRDLSSAPTQGQLTRVALWNVAWRMGKDHPWTGVGLNNYRSTLPRYLKATFEDGQTSWGTAHNLYLHHFAERGLAGLGALLLFLGTFWLRALQRARRAPDAWNLWALATATAFLVMNLTEVALQTEQLWMLVFFVWIQAEKHGGARESGGEAPGNYRAMLK